MGIVKTLDQCLALAVLPHRVARRKQEQWLSAARLAELRSQRLTTLLSRAKRAPYYAKLFAQLGIGSPADLGADALRRLPLLDKRILTSRPIEDFLTMSPRRLLKVA